MTHVAIWGYTRAGCKLTPVEFELAFTYQTPAVAA
jgi:hypothetical protein